MIDFGEKLDVLCSTVEVHKLFPKYLLLFFVMQFNREVKHDIYGKRQKWNFSLLSSALCTVESNYLYLLVNSKRHFPIFVWFI